MEINVKSSLHGVSLTEEIRVNRGSGHALKYQLTSKSAREKAPVIL